MKTATKETVQVMGTDIPFYSVRIYTFENGVKGGSKIAIWGVGE
jgi:hypothetical protein